MLCTVTVVLHTDSTKTIRVIGDNYIGYLGCGWYMLVKMYTSHGYVYLYM